MLEVRINLRILSFLTPDYSCMAVIGHLHHVSHTENCPGTKFGVFFSSLHSPFKFHPKKYFALELNMPACLQISWDLETPFHCLNTVYTQRNGIKRPKHFIQTKTFGLLYNLQLSTFFQYRPPIY